MPVLLSCSLALWLFVAVLGELNVGAESNADLSCNVVTRVLALLCYMSVALLLNSLHLFERRVSWLLSIYLWFMALSTFVQYDLNVALPSALLLVSLSVLFSCQLVQEPERRLFAAFFIIGSASFYIPLLFVFLPFMVAFTVMANVLTAKRFMAMLLGLVTPFWMVAGTAYVYSPASILFHRIGGFFASIPVGLSLPPIHVMLFMAAELLSLVPAFAYFAVSSSPGKPLLRRRLLFVMVFNACTMLLSFVFHSQSELLYACTLPGTAIMFSYVFTLKMTRFSNIYFIFVNIIWIALASYCLWMDLF